ncbi:MAG: DNA polymerase III subunit beta [Eubacterium sp.]|nr:DNA polymerase III subunit beta [Eubacterium sp.]
MIIKCKKESLINGLNIVSKAVSNKTTMPILQCVLVEAAAGKIRLTGNNTELGIETYIEGTVIEEGTSAIEAKLFMDIVKKLPDDVVTVDTSDNIRAIITCQKTKYTIAYKSGNDFTGIPIVSTDRCITLSQFTLREVIRQTIFSISDNENNPIMTGEYFEVKGNMLTVVSIDGKRISVRNVELADSAGDVSAIIPGKSLNELIKIINGGVDDKVSIYFENNNILFEFGETKVVSRLIEGDYYKISKFMSLDHKMIVSVDKKELISAIDRTTLLIQETDKKPIIVSVKDDDNMYLRVDTNMGSFNENIPVSKEGGEIIIGFNPRFLLDALRVIDDDKVKIYMSDSKNPCLIKDDMGSFTYVILPININTEVY